MSFSRRMDDVIFKNIQSSSKMLQQLFITALQLQNLFLWFNCNCGCNVWCYQWGPEDCYWQECCPAEARGRSGPCILPLMGCEGQVDGECCKSSRSWQVEDELPGQAVDWERGGLLQSGRQWSQKTHCSYWQSLCQLTSYSCWWEEVSLHIMTPVLLIISRSLTT